MLNNLDADVLTRSLLEDVTISPPIDVSDVLNNLDADVLSTPRSLLEDVTISPPIDISDVANNLDADVLTKRQYVHHFHLHIAHIR